MCDVLWSVIGKLCSTVHRVLNSKENKYSVSIVVDVACLAGYWVAGSNLGVGHF